MPVRCCVPGCSVTGGAGVHFFTMPLEETMKKKWMKAIPRKKWVPTVYSRICSAHFHEKDIKKTDVLKRSDGSEIDVPRERWRLQNNAIPTIFPGLPRYLSKPATRERMDPAHRHQRIEKQKEESFNLWLQEDKINSLQDVIINKDKYNSKDWLLKPLDDRIYFLNVCTDHAMAQIKSSILLDENLNVKLFVANRVVSINRVKSILGSNLKCDSYSKLEKLLNYMQQTFCESNSRTNEDRIECIINEINDLVNDENMPDSKIKKLNFLSHQLRLVFANKITYPVEVITFSCLFFYTFPAGYRYARDCGYFTLPHPNYLKTFATGNLETGLAEKYLTEKIKNLEPHEKYVNLLLDEIHVKKNVSYKGKKLEGLASNALEASLSPVPATTVQAFMITSLLSKNKDVVGLYPVERLQSSFLHELCLKVLKALHAAGYEVVSIITDNNQVNRKLFKSLSPHHELQPYIPSPFSPGKKLFLLFDTVHIIKNIRNNWFRKGQVITFPSFEDHSITEHARVRDLKIIHESEKGNYIKLAPSLTYKALYPSNLERQSVPLALKIFDEKNIAALDSFKDELGIESQGTKHFIDYFGKWWTVVNVKHPQKGHHLRQELAKPIEHLDQENLVFLKKFLDWLQAWEDLESFSPNVTPGKLTKETHSAIFHTTASLICLCHYLKNELGFKYVLLGKFQTDPIEHRFGLYRRMSGRNYQVSVQDILESEKKLRATSLLKLKCMNNSVICVKNMFNFNDEDDVTRDCYVENIDEIINRAENIVVDKESDAILTYIAGYVGRKASELTGCAICKESLLIDIDHNSANAKYLASLNRGGLKFPSQLALSISTIAFKIFQVVIAEPFENFFLKLKNQKQYLYSIILEKLELELLNAEYCSSHKEIVFPKFVNTWCNILLNNYSKEFNDSFDRSASTSLRKLLTLSH